MLEADIFKIRLNGLLMYFNADKYGKGVNIQEHYSFIDKGRFMLYWLSNYSIR